MRVTLALGITAGLVVLVGWTVVGWQAGQGKRIGRRKPLGIVAGASRKDSRDSGYWLPVRIAAA
jgi:hypothetical protein